MTSAYSIDQMAISCVMLSYPYSFPSLPIAWVYLTAKQDWKLYRCSHMMNVLARKILQLWNYQKTYRNIMYQELFEAIR